MGWNDRICPHKLKSLFPDVYRDTYPDSEPQDVVTLWEMIKFIERVKEKEAINEEI